MDAIFDSSRFGTLPKAYGWIRDRREDEGFLNKLVDCSIRHADAATRRRVGCVLEMLDAGGKRLDKLHKKTPETRSVIPLVPGGNRIPFSAYPHRLEDGHTPVQRFASCVQGIHTSSYRGAGFNSS